MKRTAIIIIVAALLAACGQSYEETKRITREQRREAARKDSAALKIAVMPTLDCLPLFVAKKEQLLDSLHGGVRLKMYNAQMDCDTAIARGRVEGAVTEFIRAQRLERQGTELRHVGKTSFAEWSSIIEYAHLVVGNDSATLHIAAGHRVKAICIAGIYDKYQFFPYKVDELDDGDRLPETVSVDMPCAYCRTKGYHAGYGNTVCQRSLKVGKCALCINAIDVEMVKKKIVVLTKC